MVSQTFPTCRQLPYAIRLELIYQEQFHFMLTLEPTHHLLNWKSCVYRFIRHRGAMSSFPCIPHPFSASNASPELGLCINFHLCAYFFMVTGCCPSAYIFFIAFCFYLFVLSSSGSSTSQKVRDWDWATGWSSCITTIPVSTWLLCVTACQCWPVQKCTF